MGGEKGIYERNEGEERFQMIKDSRRHNKKKKKEHQRGRHRELTDEKKTRFLVILRFGSHNRMKYDVGASNSGSR